MTRPMEELLKHILEALVDKPEAIVIERRENENGITLEVTVDPDDIGQVIGRGGRRAQAIRQIMKSKGMRTGDRIYVDILDECKNN